MKLWTSAETTFEIQVAITVGSGISVSPSTVSFGGGQEENVGTYIVTEGDISVEVDSIPIYYELKTELSNYLLETEESEVAILDMYIWTNLS